MIPSMRSLVFINNIRLQDLNRRKAFALAACTQIHLHRDNIQFNRIAIAFWLSQFASELKRLFIMISALRRFSSRLLPRAVGKIGGNARIFGGIVILIEARAFILKVKSFFIASGHPDFCLQPDAVLSFTEVLKTFTGLQIQQWSYCRKYLT